MLLGLNEDWSSVKDAESALTMLDMRPKEGAWGARAEMFQLRGSIFVKMGRIENAYEDLLTACSIERRELGRKWSEVRGVFLFQVIGARNAGKERPHFGAQDMAKLGDLLLLEDVLEGKKMNNSEEGNVGHENYPGKAILVEAADARKASVTSRWKDKGFYIVNHRFRPLVVFPNPENGKPFESISNKNVCIEEEDSHLENPQESKSPSLCG